MSPATGTGPARSAEVSPEVHETAETVRAPQLSFENTGWLDGFKSSVRILFSGPAAPKEFLGDPYFRDCWIDSRFPKLAFAAAVGLQILLILFPPPIWNAGPARAVAPPADMKLTWYGPIKDLPAILPAAKKPKSAPREMVAKAPPATGAEAFHPRQIILSEPLRPTHPRQTLVQLKAPPLPPKILPALPNIVQIANSQPARPKLDLTAMRPKTPKALAASNSVAPDVPIPEKEAGVINIASSMQAPSKPAMPVSPMSAPRAMTHRGETNAAVPDIGGRTGNAGTLIALSATPAPGPPPPAIPPGNLSARISISPDGPRPGAPGGAKTGSGASGGTNGGGGGSGPEGIYISGGKTANTSPVSGLGIGSASRSEPPAHPLPRAAMEGSSAPPLKSGSAKESSKLNVPPEKIFADKKVYTLNVNLPNMTSASGSWVLNFAELDELDGDANEKPASSDLSGPVPLRKVDPKYPPELRAGHVEGDVILYAIIRKDGSVDSIQLVHSADPVLDADAMEALAQWKFEPGRKRGKAVDLEAVVHIPFRSRAPQF